MRLKSRWNTKVSFRGDKNNEIASEIHEKCIEL